MNKFYELKGSPNDRTNKETEMRNNTNFFFKLYFLDLDFLIYKTSGLKLKK